LPLNRGDVNNHPGALLQHRWQERAIQTDGREEIKVERPPRRDRFGFGCLDKIVLDAELLEAVLGTPDPRKKSREIEIKISKRLRQHQGNPAYKKLSERLEALKERHEQGQLHSVQFLKELLDLARELLELERATPPEKDEDRGKAALTELFEEARATRTRRSSSSAW
jgi:hypothetical protein